MYQTLGNHFSDPAFLDTVWASAAVVFVITMHRNTTPPHHLTLERFTTMVPATISYTVLLCWKKRSVMKAGKKKAIEKFLFKARMADL